MKSTKRPPKAVLRELSSGVEDIMNEFDWLGFSTPTNTAPDVKPQGQGNGGQVEELVELEEEDLDRDPYQTFNREDVEIGVDQLISRMIQKKLVEKEKTGSQPSLWRVFTTFYGKAHPIIALIDSFELNIKGYFGTIGYNEMQAAFEDLLGVQKLIEDDLEASGD